jgi:hypothetical protein
MVGDIGNAYLTVLTGELVYVVTGPEFGSQQGNTLIIRKALFGLIASGARFHEKLRLIHFETLIASQTMQTQMSGSRTVVLTMST